MLWVVGIVFVLAVDEVEMKLTVVINPKEESQ